MSEFEPPVYEAGTFWGQVKRGITGLVLPEECVGSKERGGCLGRLACLSGRQDPTDVAFR